MPIITIGSQNFEIKNDQNLTPKDIIKGTNLETGERVTIIIVEIRMRFIEMPYRLGQINRVTTIKDIVARKI